MNSRSVECHYVHCDFHDGNSIYCHRAMCLATQKELELFAIIHDQEKTISDLHNLLEKHKCKPLAGENISTST